MKNWLSSLLLLALVTGASPYHVSRARSRIRLARAPQGEESGPGLRCARSLYGDEQASSLSSPPISIVDYHSVRRKQFLSKATDRDRERLKALHKAKSLVPGSAALAACTGTLIYIAAMKSLAWKFGLAATVGGVASVWQLQVLHDCLHQTFSSSRKLNERLLFGGSIFAFVGYYTYLKFGHVGHHDVVGKNVTVGLGEVFDSPGESLLDADVLFARHRQEVKPEDEGPIWRGEVFSISKYFRDLWRRDANVRNMLIFCFSFPLER